MKKPYEFEIKARYAGLRMSERKVADIYLSWDKDFEELSLAALAEKAGVSQPSVMRFVKAMGFDGFKEFKYAILKARGEQEAIGEDERNSAGFPPPLVYGYAISEGDSLEEMPGRIISQAISCLGDTLKQISSEKIQKAAEMICSARQIAVYYVENSASVAQDLVTKLLYLGFNCMMYSDIYLQEISASNLREGDLAIGVSHSGSSKSTVDAIRQARKSGASVLCLTNQEDALIGKWADLLLCTENRQMLYGNAIFSRISEIAVVDMIYVGVILSDYKKYTERLDRSSRIVRKHGYENTKK